MIGVGRPVVALDDHFVALGGCLSVDFVQRYFVRQLLEQHDK